MLPPGAGATVAGVTDAGVTDVYPVITVFKAN